MVNFIPDVVLPIDLTSYLSPLINVFGYIDTFIDLGVITLCISAILIVDSWSLIVKLVLKNLGTIAF